MHDRSWLTVPGDNETQLGAALTSGADVIVIDLEATVAPSAKPRARQLALEWLEAHGKQIVEQRRTGRWVRINPLTSRIWREDLLSVMAGAPDGIVVPKALGPAQIQQIAAELYELEQRFHIPTGATRILPVVGETAQAALTIPAYLDASLPRLTGLTWASPSLACSLGATRERDDRGIWADSFRFVRAQTLLTAAAREIVAIDTGFADLADRKGLTAAAQAARADGFAGMIAIDMAQVETINAVFTPSEAEVALAHAVVAAGTASDPGADAQQRDRRTSDPAQLQTARRTIGLAPPTKPQNSGRPILRSA